MAEGVKDPAAAGFPRVADVRPGLTNPCGNQSPVASAAKAGVNLQALGRIPQPREKLRPQALELYWYRRFYTETLTGQLMVLRPDEPTLYHYERAQTRDNCYGSSKNCLESNCKSPEGCHICESPLIEFHRRSCTGEVSLDGDSCRPT